MFVALVGPDGSGKTTVAAALEGLADEAGWTFRYQHWVPTRTNRPSATVISPETPPPKLAVRDRVRPADIAMSVLRLWRALARFWVGYLIRIRPARHSSSSLVVADRWMYNYVGQPHSVAYYGPAWLARAAVRIGPAPDVIAILQVPGHIVASRKGELSAAEVEDENDRWVRSIGSWHTAVVLDATRSPRELAEQIAGFVSPRGVRQ